MEVLLIVLQGRSITVRTRTTRSENPTRRRPVQCITCLPSFLLNRRRPGPPSACLKRVCTLSEPQRSDSEGDRDVHTDLHGPGGGGAIFSVAGVLSSVLSGKILLTYFI